MDKKEHIIIYKESIWSRIKNKLLSLFFKTKKCENISDNEQTANIQLKNKEEIMDIYYKVKSKEINLDELDDDTLYKIMLLLREEIEIKNKKVIDKTNELKMHLYNIKMYSKDIELAKKNS